MRLISLFTGVGGLDLGFEQAGFKVVWANEFDKVIWETFESNFPHVKLDRRSISEIPSSDIPDAEGIIGGPPCQSWSEAGARRGIKDARGQLFFEYIRVIRDKKPLFFLAENVSGMLLNRNREAFEDIFGKFHRLGYNVNYALLNANEYEVPQDRKRVIIVGYHKDLNKDFIFPSAILTRPTLQDAISDMPSAQPAKDGNKPNNPQSLYLSNHEYMNGGFSPIYMSRNRVRSWDEPSYTIQAGGRHAPIHPQAPKMKLIGHNKRVFVAGQEHLYRRLSVRECARIQTFPDDFLFKYNNVADGYKMIGNAVPVKFARHLADKIANDLQNFFD